MTATTPAPTTGPITGPVALVRAVLKQIADGRTGGTLPFPRGARTRVTSTTAGAAITVTHVTRAWALDADGWSPAAAVLADKLGALAAEHDGVSVLIDLGAGDPLPFCPVS